MPAPLGRGRFCDEDRLKENTRGICISHCLLTVFMIRLTYSRSPQTNAEMSVELEKQLKNAGLL